MNGAESLLKTLINNNIDVCFCNPGTSEMHFVAALDKIEGMDCILCLFEGSISGAAGGYALMARKPASTLLHLGPGLGNALANMHNAKKGHIPIINIIGDHATYHLKYDAPLTSDIESIAGSVSHWVHTSKSANEIARDCISALREAINGKIASLILPADVSWGENENGPEGSISIEKKQTVSDKLIEKAVDILHSGQPTVIMIGGREIDRDSGMKLGRIAKVTGARLCAETFPSRMARGAGTAVMERLPYLAEMALEHLKDIENLILIGAGSPVSFFAYPGVPGRLVPENCQELMLAGPNDDINYAIDQLMMKLQAEVAEPELNELHLPEMPAGALNAHKIAATLACTIPDKAIIVDEAITSGMPIFPMTCTARAHDWLNLAGGSIGWGLPAAIGAAVACPDRKVICLEGDGSAMYTIQSLWTMAREDLDIIVIVFNNKKYCILEMEYSRIGAVGGTPGVKAASTMSIGDPDLNFVKLARGMGVEAYQVTTAEEFNSRMQEALNHRGPSLIDAIIPALFR